MEGNSLTLHQKQLVSEQASAEEDKMNDM